MTTRRAATTVAAVATVAAVSNGQPGVQRAVQIVAAASAGAASTQ